MFLWERLQQPAQSSVALAELFTPQELARLVALRARSRALCVSEETGLDLNHLAFAQWLVEHGRLSEDH